VASAERRNAAVSRKERESRTQENERRVHLVYGRKSYAQRNLQAECSREIYRSICRKSE